MSGVRRTALWCTWRQCALALGACTAIAMTGLAGASAGGPAAFAATGTATPIGTPAPTGSPTSNPGPNQAASQSPVVSPGPSPSPSPVASPGPSASPSPAPTTACPIPNEATGSTGTGVSFTRTIVSVEGRCRLVHYYIPTGLTGPAPLVVALHGRWNLWSNFRRVTRLDAEADQGRFVVAYPEGLRETWNAGSCCGYAQQEGIDDVAFLDQVLDQAFTVHSIATDQVHLVGFSNGGMLAYRYACERSERISSIAVVAATLVTPCARHYPVAVYAIHGVNYTDPAGRVWRGDPSVPWLGCSNSRVHAGCADPTLGPSLPSVPSVLLQWNNVNAPWCVGTQSTMLRGFPHAWPTPTARYSPVQAPFNATHAIWNFLWHDGARATAPTGGVPALPAVCVQADRAGTSITPRGSPIIFAGSVRPAPPSIGDYWWRIRFTDSSGNYYSATSRTIITGQPGPYTSR